MSKDSLKGGGAQITDSIKIFGKSSDSSEELRIDRRHSNSSLQGTFISQANVESPPILSMSSEEIGKNKSLKTRTGGQFHQFIHESKSAQTLSIL